MRRIDWTKWFQWLVVALVILFAVARLWATWSVCNGDIACVIVGPKFVVTQEAK